MLGKYSDLVDYGKLDPVKKAAFKKFESTFENLERLRIRVMPVGESAAVLDFLDYDFMLGFNVEGLGTKNDISDKMYGELKQKAEIGKEMKVANVYHFIGQDTVAMSLNDLVSVGADPIVYGDFLTSGDSDWFDDMDRVDELLEGYKIAADLAGCAIPCGETPTLPDIVNPNTLVLEGASVGLIKPKERFCYGQRIVAGDRIYGLPATSPNANGISKLRRITDKLPNGYFTRMPNGRLLGLEMLTPTPIYVRAIIEMFDQTELHYVSAITGHAWEKVGRARFPFTYIIESLPEVPSVFQYLIEEVKRINPKLPKKKRFDVSDRENYFVWNMGTTTILIAPQSSGSKMRQIAEKYNIELQELGKVKKGPRQVLMPFSENGKQVVYTP
jgi:phosphoribosylformylglycinamidine cyclo-ligase